jgi:predicted dehydrogenase
MTFEPVRIALVGANNFARSHARSIAQMEQEGLGELVCACIRSPHKHPDMLADYEASGTKLYTSYEQMLEAERGRVELVALPVAIPDHAETSIAAMEAGYHVLVEKPPAATVQDVDAMTETSERTGFFCDVGFQNQSKNTVRELKRRICEGRLGTIERIAVKAEWVRLDSYYARNGWAGQMVYQGKYCLDGPTNNALAHYMFNALYWASATWGHADAPARVRGELYHAHPIPGEDTSAIAVETAGGCRITYLTTLAGWETMGPLSHLEGTGGVADWSHTGGTVITYADGTEEVIEPDGQREHDEVFRNAIRYLRGVDEELNAPIAMTRPLTVAVNGAYESGAPPREVPAEHVTREPRDDDVFTAINGIRDILDRCNDAHQTFSEAGVPWAYETDWFDTSDYRRFEMEL